MSATTFSDAIARARLRPFQMLVAFATFMVLVFDGISMQSLPLVAPMIFAEWGIDRAEFGPAMAAALFGMAIGAATGGWLGDRFGRLNTLSLAALTFGLATVAAGYADDVFTMTVVRVIAGLGFGGVFPNCMALANDWMPPRLRSYTVATLSLGVPAGTMLSGMLVPMLVPLGSWQGVFLGFGAASAILAVIVLFSLKESPAYFLARGKPDKAQQVARLALAQAVPLAPEPEAGETSTDSAARVGVFHPSNLRLNLGVGIGFASATAVVYGLNSWAPEMLVSSGFSLPQAQQVGVAIGAASIIGGFLAGYCSKRFGSRAVTAFSAVGTCVLVVALAVLVESLPAEPSAIQRHGVNLLIGAITGVTSLGIATIYVMMAQGYQQSCRSGGIGFGMFVGRIGGILMAFFGGVLLNMAGNSFMAFFAALLLGGIGILAASLIVDRHVLPFGRMAKAAGLAV